MNRLVLSIFVVMLFCFTFVHAEEFFVSEREYANFPEINVTKKEYPLPSSGLLSSIEPIRVADPYVTAGQPFIIEFTLENIGDELGFPFNQIALSPNSYTLVLMADNQYDKIILPNGQAYDLWSKMTPWEQFSFALGTSVSSFGEFVSQQLEGRSCGYVDVWTAIPPRLQDEITIANGGKRPKALLNWSCIRLVDEAYFNTKVNQLCQGQLNVDCLQKINEGTYVGDTVMVALTNTTAKNKCIRVEDKGFWYLLGSAITNRMNAVECGIGENGIAPGQEATFSFVGLVPADTPVLSPADFADVTEINEGFTQSASCLGTTFPENCHTVYAGVFPTAKDNLLKIIADTVVGNLITAGQALFGTLYNMDLSVGQDIILTSGGITNKVVGAPIWEGRGIFFVVGPGLRGSIEIILLLTLIAGGLTGASLGRRTGA